MKETNSLPELDKQGLQFVRWVLGTLLFNTQADNQMLITPLSAIASEQANRNNTQESQAIA